MEKRDAVTAIVRDYHDGLGTDDLGYVVLDQLHVSSEAVAPPRRLVREPIAWEVQCADAEARAELIRDLEPIDAAGRPAVNEQHHRSVGVTDLNMENFDR